MTPAPDLGKPDPAPQVVGSGPQGPSAFSIYKTLEKLDDSIMEYRASNHLDAERKVVWTLLHTTVKAGASLAFALGESGERWG